jgi:hypothetical protein
MMIRGEIPIATVHGYRRKSADEWEFRPDPSQPIAYLRITTIGPSTVSEVRKMATHLSDHDVHGVVLDLRRSTGSDGDFAALFADEFLAAGAIGRVRYAAGMKQYDAQPDQLFARLPIALLIDEDTNSGAEFFAAALQDNGRAVAVGQQTAGVAYVYSPVTLPDELGGVMLPAGEFLRAHGRRIQGPNPQGHRLPFSAAPQRRDRRSPRVEGDWGVKPDHPVPIDDRVRTDIYNWITLQERPDGASDPPPDDPQLRHAVKVLQAASKLL